MLPNRRLYPYLLQFGEAFSTGYVAPWRDDLQHGKVFMLLELGFDIFSKGQIPLLLGGFEDLAELRLTAGHRA